MPGAVFAPMHWSTRYSSHGGIGALVNADTDPISGQPELKHTPAAVSAYAPLWQAFLATMVPLARAALSGMLWAAARTRGGWRYELAGEHAPADWRGWAESAVPAPHGGDWLSYEDPAAGLFRYARLVEGRLAACLFVAPERPVISRDWLVELLAERPPLPDPTHLLAGRPLSGERDRGRLICACFGVAEGTIRERIGRERLGSIDAIGRALKAGTNCGSCRAELAQLLRHFTEASA
jgi:assimilatory nitrate reductase catalytic subunit